MSILGMELDLPGMAISLFAEGGKAAVVSTQSYNKRVFWSDESTQVYFFDRGNGQLNVGNDTVFLDPIYVESICDTCSYLVQITPTSDCNGLCVLVKATTYFVVHELASGISNTTYDWEVQALRKLYEEVRLPEFVEPAKK